MSRRRWLSTDISKDARVRKLAADAGEFAALVYSWAIPHASDDGSIPSDPDELLMLVVPGFRWRTTEDMQNAIDAMLTLGLLEQCDDRLRFPPGAFYKYQTYVTADRRETAQNGAQQRETPPSSYLTSSSSSYLGSGTTLSLRPSRVRAGEAKSCSACRTPLQRRAADGLCAECHGLAIVWARQTNVDVEHISLVDLVGLAIRAREVMQPDGDLPSHDDTDRTTKSDQTAARSRGTPE
jgi:hypothetical protein